MKRKICFVKLRFYERRKRVARSRMFSVCFWSREIIINKWKHCIEKKNVGVGVVLVKKRGGSGQESAIFINKNNILSHFFEGSRCLGWFRLSQWENLNKANSYFGIFDLGRVSLEGRFWGCGEFLRSRHRCGRHAGGVLCPSSKPVQWCVRVERSGYAPPSPTKPPHEHSNPQPCADFGNRLNTFHRA